MLRFIGKSLCFLSLCQVVLSQQQEFWSPESSVTHPPLPECCFRTKQPNPLLNGGNLNSPQPRPFTLVLPEQGDQPLQYQEEQYLPPTQTSGDQGEQIVYIDQGSQNQYGDQGSQNPYGDQGSQNPYGDQETQNPYGDQGSQNPNGDQGSQNPYGVIQGTQNPYGDQGSPNVYDSGSAVYSGNQGAAQGGYAGNQGSGYAGQGGQDSYGDDGTQTIYGNDGSNLESYRPIPPTYSTEPETDLDPRLPARQPTGEGGNRYTTTYTTVTVSQPQQSEDDEQQQHTPEYPQNIQSVIDSADLPDLSTYNPEDNLSHLLSIASLPTTSTTVTVQPDAPQDETEHNASEEGHEQKIDYVTFPFEGEANQTGILVNSSRESANDTRPRSFPILQWLLKAPTPWTKDDKIEDYLDTVENATLLNLAKNEVEPANFSRADQKADRKLYFHTVDDPKGNKKIASLSAATKTPVPRKRREAKEDFPSDWLTNLQRAVFHSLAGAEETSVPDRNSSTVLNDSVTSPSEIDRKYDIRNNLRKAGNEKQKQNDDAVWKKLQKAQIFDGRRKFKLSSTNGTNIASGLLVKSRKGGFRFQVLEGNNKTSNLSIQESRINRRINFDQECLCGPDALAYWSIQKQQLGTTFNQQGVQAPMFAMVYMVYPLVPQKAMMAPAFGFLPNQMQNIQLQGLPLAIPPTLPPPPPRQSPPHRLYPTHEPFIRYHKFIKDIQDTPLTQMSFDPSLFVGTQEHYPTFNPQHSGPTIPAYRPHLRRPSGFAYNGAISQPAVAKVQHLTLQYGYQSNSRRGSYNGNTSNGGFSPYFQSRKVRFPGPTAAPSTTEYKPSDSKPQKNIMHLFVPQRPPLPNHKFRSQKTQSTKV